MTGAKLFTDQSQTCTKTGHEVKADTILDKETHRQYFVCPACGEAHVKRPKNSGDFE